MQPSISFKISINVLTKRIQCDYICSLIELLTQSQIDSILGNVSS